MGVLSQERTARVRLQVGGLGKRKKGFSFKLIYIYIYSRGGGSGSGIDSSLPSRVFWRREKKKCFVNDVFEFIPPFI